MTRLFLPALFLLPSLAHAHPGHGASDFTGGLIHPLLGVDHLVAALAVGLWAAQLGGRSLRTVPLSFLGVMGLGIACGLAGRLVVPIEGLIALSVLVLGLVVAVGRRLPAGVSVALVGAFGFLHGLVHGCEAPHAGGLSYAAGLFLCTAGLSLAGVCVGHQMLSTGRGALVRVGGAAVLIAGVLCAIG